MQGHVGDVGWRQGHVGDVGWRCLAASPGGVAQSIDGGWTR